MENQEQNQPDVNVSQAGSPTEPAGQQPPEPTGPQPPEPAKPGVVPFEPVKSQTTKVQETVDRNLAEQADRQKLTDEVITKRKQTAALEAKAALEQAAAVTSAEQKVKTGPGLANGLRKAADIVDSKTAEAAEAVQAANDAVQVVGPSEPAESCTGLPEDEARQATEAILKQVMKTADAREIREIEMHNSAMDAMKEVTAQSVAICDLLSDIGGSMKDMSKALIDIAGKA